MTRVTLPLDAPLRHDPATCRVRLSLEAVELAAEVTGALLPWQHPTACPPQRLEAALGGAHDAAAAAMPGPTHDPVLDPVLELRRAGLLSGAPPRQLRGEVRAALTRIAAGPVLVDIDLVVRGEPGAPGVLRLRSWHRLHGDAYAAVSTLDGRTTELAWGADTGWPAELARTVTVEPPTGRAGSPAAIVELPWELLVAGGRVLHEGRGDLLAELVGRTPGGIRVATSADGDPAAVSAAVGIEQVQRLHHALRGWLRATVGGVRPDGSRCLALVSWLLFPDGWRALVPVTTPTRSAAPGAGPLALVRPCAPDDLAVAVAGHVTGIRS